MSCLLASSPSCSNFSTRVRIMANSSPTSSSSPSKMTELNHSASKLLVAYSDSSGDDSDIDVEFQVIEVPRDVQIIEVTRDVQIFEDRRNDSDKDAEVQKIEDRRNDSDKDVKIQIVEDRRSVCSYDSESDSDSSSSSDESSSHSDVDDECDDVDDDCDDDHQTKNCPVKSGIRNPRKTKGEFGLEDLPPIQDLHISIPKADVQQIGNVFTIVDCQVTIQTFAGLPALNLDAMLFNENGEGFGQVFDIFGPVSQPFYVVRFNSNSDIVEKKISVKMPIYFAPMKQEYTTFVFVEQLKKMKGCDASWKDDNEPPESKLEYSDDEKEILIKKHSKLANVKTKKKLHSPSTNGQQTRTETSSNVWHKQDSNTNVGPFHGRRYDRRPHPCIRPPVFNYTSNSALATPSTNMPMQQGFPQFYSQYQQPLFPVHLPPPLPGQQMWAPRFFSNNQMSSDTGYPYQLPQFGFNSIRPPNRTLPPLPSPSASAFNVRCGGINPSVQHSAMQPSVVPATNNESSAKEGDLLPNPFRESHTGAQGLDNSNVHPPLPCSVTLLETSAVPMFPPSGFMLNSSSI